MDIVEKLVRGHRGLFEREDIIVRLSRAIDNDAFFWDSAVKVSEFFRKEVRQHFAMEEHVLFPVLRRALPADKLPVLDAIEGEHGPLREKLAHFEVISQGHNRFPSRVTREELVRAAQDILEPLLEHARREDRELFPLVNGALAPEDCRELERLYAGFSKTGDKA